jgi:hypothetical protein
MFVSWQLSLMFCLMVPKLYGLLDSLLEMNCFDFADFDYLFIESYLREEDFITLMLNLMYY